MRARLAHLHHQRTEAIPPTVGPGRHLPKALHGYSNELKRMMRRGDVPSAKARVLQMLDGDLVVTPDPETRAGRRSSAGMTRPVSFRLLRGSLATVDTTGARGRF